MMQTPYQSVYRQKKSRAKRIRGRLVRFLAFVVVFITSYALILPAITLEISKLHPSDESADVETAPDWEATLPTDLTGIWADDLIAVAESQLDYEESTRNYQIVDDEVHGYTRYGAWSGSPYEDWRASFVSFCLNYAGISDEAFPRETSLPDWVEALREHGMYASAADYTPDLGDLIFIDEDQDDAPDRVGIVCKTGVGSWIEAIEGDVDGKVSRCSYVQDDPQLLGCAKLPLSAGTIMIDPRDTTEPGSESPETTEYGTHFTFILKNVNRDMDITVYCTRSDLPYNNPFGYNSYVEDNIVFDQPTDPPRYEVAGSKRVILGRGGEWEQRFTVSGDGLLTDESMVLPASCNGNQCFYTLSEPNVPDGYELMQISEDRVDSGVLSAYNRQNALPLDLIKTDQDDSSRLLNGAKFRLFQINPDLLGNLTVRSLEGGLDLEEITSGEGENAGQIHFDDIQKGYYLVWETAAPPGYVLSGNTVFAFRLTDDGFELLEIDETLAAKYWTKVDCLDGVSLENGRLTVSNEPGKPLPSTGGVGTERFTLFGVILIAGAAVLYGHGLWRKRKGGNE